MTSEVLVGTLCGVGVGLLVGIVCSIIYVYWKKKKTGRLKKTRRKSNNVSGRAIIPQDIPEFQIPPIIPMRIQTPTTRETQPVSPMTLSPPVSPRRMNSARRASVQLEDILTSVSANDNPVPRKQSLTAFTTTNETAIANLYSQQKKAIGKKKKLKHSSTSAPFGKLEFSLFYDQNLQELQIYVVRGIQVYVPGSDGETSLVLKAVILFDGEEVWQDTTKVVEDGSNPDFSEQLTVGLSINKMRKGLLKLIILNKKTEQGVGEVVYPLSNLPFNFFNTEVMKLTEVDTQEYSTEEGDHSKQNGELLISMCHNRNDKKLTVVVECARDLPIMSRGFTDSFVKVEIMFVGKKLQSRTTPVFAKNRSPEYSARFDFVIPDDKLPQITVVFKVKHQGKLRDHTIGMVKLGYGAVRETEYRHLEQVLGKPHLSIENWHIIEKYK